MKGIASALVAALLLAPLASSAGPDTGVGKAIGPHQPPFTVHLNAVGGSGESGWARFAQGEDPSTTNVSIEVTGEPGGANQPAHIHAGTCVSPGSITYGLTNVVNGKSSTDLPKPLSWFKNAGFIIVVHKSNTQLGIYKSCGTHILI